MGSWTAWATRLPCRPRGLGHVRPEEASPRLTWPVAHVWVSPTLSSWGLFWSFFDPFAICPAHLSDQLITVVCLSVCPFTTLPLPDCWLSPLPVPVSRTPPGRAVSTGLATPSPGAVRTRVPRRSRFALKQAPHPTPPAFDQRGRGGSGAGQEARSGFRGSGRGWDGDEAGMPRGRGRERGLKLEGPVWVPEATSPRTGGAEGEKALSLELTASASPGTAVG